jgi:uncharacterized protein YbcI
VAEALARTGELAAQISNAIVGILSELYGRGPTRTKTYLLDDYVFTVCQDILTTAEQTLVEHGHEDLVRKVRLTFQEAEADRFTGAVREITGRTVITYHSQVTFDPPMGFEIFVLEPADEEEPGGE